MKELKLNFTLVFFFSYLFCNDIVKGENGVGDNSSSSCASEINDNNNRKHQGNQQKYNKTISLFPPIIFKINITENDNTLQFNNPLEASDTMKSKINKSNVNYNINSENRHHSLYQQNKNDNSIINFFAPILNGNTILPAKTNAFTTNHTNDNITKKNNNIMSLLRRKPISKKSLTIAQSSSSPSSALSSTSLFSKKLQNLPTNSVTTHSQSVGFIDPDFTSIFSLVIKDGLENNSKKRNQKNIYTSTTTIRKINSMSNKTTIPFLFSSYSSIANDNNNNNNNNNNNSNNNNNTDNKSINNKASYNKIPTTVNDGNVIISDYRHRNIRDVSNFEEDEIGWTNINEEVDMTIPLVLSHFLELGMTHFKLPDVKEGISVSPLFLTYLAELTLFNGAAYNIEGIYRIGDAMMTYRDKAFQVRLNLIIKKLQFEYDFIAKAMIISVAGGVVGSLEDILVSCDFSVDVRDPVLRLNDFHIEKFGNIIVQLNHNRIVQELSTFVLTPITNLFRDRITTTISADIKGIISETLVDFSNKDQLGIKKFTRQALSGLIKANLNSSEKMSK